MKRVIAILLLLAMILCLSACGKKEEAAADGLKVEDIRAICELATLKCCYNNVAEVNKPKDNIFQKERKMWIEYTGVAYIGIDMAEIGVVINDNVVDITMPKAKVLDITYDKDTLDESSYISSADGLLFKNKITVEEQENAVKAAQQIMREEVEANKALFIKAESNAKELFENYITNVGEAIGKEYTISWK